MKLTQNDLNQLNEIIHQLKWNGGIKVSDSMDFPALDYLEVNVYGTYKIDDPIELKDFIVEHADDLELSTYLHDDIKIATSRLNDALNELAQDGILTYAKGIHLAEHHLETSDV